MGGMSVTLVVEVLQAEAKRLPDSSVLQVLFAPVAGVGSREGMTGSGSRPGRLLELLVMEVAETAEEPQPLAVMQLLLRSLRSQTGRKSRSKRWLWRDIPHQKHEKWGFCSGAEEHLKKTRMLNFFLPKAIKNKICACFGMPMFCIEFLCHATL